MIEDHLRPTQKIDEMIKIGEFASQTPLFRVHHAWGQASWLHIDGSYCGNARYYTRGPCRPPRRDGFPVIRMSVQECHGQLREVETTAWCERNTRGAGSHGYGLLRSARERRRNRASRCHTAQGRGLC